MHSSHSASLSRHELLVGSASLMALGLVLFVITFAVLAAARLLIARQTPA